MPPLLAVLGPAVWYRWLVPYIPVVPYLALQLWGSWSSPHTHMRKNISLLRTLQKWGNGIFPACWEMHGTIDNCLWLIYYTLKHAQTDVDMLKLLSCKGELEFCSHALFFYFMAKRSRSFAKELVWVIRLFLSIFACNSFAGFCYPPVALGCSIIVAITPSVGLFFVGACVPCVLVFCKRMQVESLEVINWLERESSAEYPILLN